MGLPTLFLQGRCRRRDATGCDTQLYSKNYRPRLIIIRMTAMAVGVNIAEWVGDYILMC